MPSDPREASSGCRLGDTVWLGGREDRRLETEEIDSRLLGTCTGGGMGRENEEDRSDGVSSSTTAVLAPGCVDCCCWNCCSWACWLRIICSRRFYLTLVGLLSFFKLKKDLPLAPLAPVLIPGVARQGKVRAGGAGPLSRRRGCRRDWWDWPYGMHGRWRSGDRARGSRRDFPRR